MLRHIPNRIVSKIAAVALVASQMVLGVPIVAQTRTAMATRLPAPKVTVNKTVPKVSPPPSSPTFSSQPTVAEIFRARVFTEPLVPVGGMPSADENVALADALMAFHRDGRASWKTNLATFLAAYPSSTWRPSLLAGLGEVQLQGHQYGQALRSWDEVWTLTKDDPSPRGRAVADYAVAEWLTLAGDMGQLVAFDDRLRELDGRNMSGSAGIKVARARESSYLIRMHPDRITLCGPAALQALMLAFKPGAAIPKALTDFKGSLDGTTLTEMQALARQAGMKVQMVRRTTATEVPVPSIVHWTVGHYATVLEHKDGQYRILDKSRGNDYWITAETLMGESSGYFLIPENMVGPGWLRVSVEDGDAIRGLGPLCEDGSGPPGPPPDGPPPCPPPGGGGPSDQSCRRCPSGPGAGGGGPSCGGGPVGPSAQMVGYQLQPVTASLLLWDSPAGYTPPRGPEVPFTVSYHQREMLQPQTFSFSNVGPKWVFNWMRFVKEEPTDALGVTPVHTWVALLPGGREVYVNPDGQGVFPAHWSSQAVLVRTSTSPIRYERRLSDGSVEKYEASDGAPAGSRRVFLTKIVDPQGLTLELTWDSQMRLIAITDAIGQVSTIAYDLGTDPLKITSIADPFGREATFQYNAVGQLESITDVMGLQSRMQYGGDDFVSTLTTPYGTTSFRHEPSALNSMFNTRFIEATDPLGATEHLEFQFETPSLSATASTSEVPTGFSSWNTHLNRFNTFYWDKRAWQQGPNDLSKATITHWLTAPEWAGWQVYSQPVPHSEKRPLETRVWYAYPGQTDTTAIGTSRQPSAIARVLDDGSTKAETAMFNDKGMVLTRTDAVGRVTSYTYDTNGIDLLSVHQGTDLVASYDDYALHRAQDHSGADGESELMTYNASGQILTATDSEGATTTYGYDASGYLTSVTGALTGDVTTMTYDGYGRIRTLTNSDSYTITLDYDLFNRVIRTTYPDDSFDELTYNRLDVESRRDRLGRVTKYYYDALGRVIGIRDPAGRTTTLRWCGCGSLDAILDANGRSRAWTRDLAGRVTSETGPSGPTFSYEYETNTSRLKRRTDANGQHANYEYFKDGLIKQLTYTDAVVTTPSVSMTYDASYPRLSTVTDGTGTTTFSYHAAGNAGALQVSSVNGPLANDTISYAYDDLGRVASRTLGSVTNTWSRDDLGRLESFVDPVGTFSFSYDGVTSRLSEVTCPNGQTSTYSYFGNAGDHRLQEIHHQTSAGATLSRFTYAYDLAGQITTWTQQHESTTRAYDFGYDAADQLTSATYRTTGGSPTILARYAYAYDAAGNRTNQQLDDAPTGWTYDALNRLTAQAGTAQLKFEGTVSEASIVTVGGKPATVNGSNQFAGLAAVTNGTNTVAVTATDATGNTRTQEYQVEVSNATAAFSYDANGNLTARGTRTYSWDAENRLVAVADNGTAVATFGYDGFGRRIAKVAGGVTHNYVYDAAMMLEERIVGGSTTRNVIGAQVSIPLATVDDNGDPAYHLSDHLGSIVQTTDASGVVTLTRQYDPFGNPFAGETVSGGAFTGQEWDAETGLYYYRTRYYDPAVGRFLSEDPLASLQGVVGRVMPDGPNPYGYVRNNPVNRVDQNGLQGGPGGTAVTAPQITVGEEIVEWVGRACLVGAETVLGIIAIAGTVLSQCGDGCGDKRGRYTCTAKCQVNNFSRIPSLDEYAYGIGHGNSEDEAVKAARSAALAYLAAMLKAKGVTGATIRHCSYKCFKR